MIEIRHVGNDGSTLLESLTHEQAEGLEAYLNKLWEAGHAYNNSQYSQTTSTTQQFVQFVRSKACYKLKPKKYIGFVVYQDLEISIWPRVFDESITAEKRFEHLNNWLELAGMTSFRLTTADTVEDEQCSLFELFVRYFAQLAHELAYHEPYSQYQPMTEELSTIKGSLNMGQYINNNIVTGKWHHFTCDYAPFEYDNLFNRIIKYVCRLLTDRTKFAEAANQLDAVIALYQDVSDQHITAQDCDKVRLNGMFGRHQHLLDLAKIFLNDLHLLPDQAGDPSFSFFLNMSKLFEQLVTNLLINNHPNLEFDAQPQSEKLAVHKSKGYYTLKPDLLVRQEWIIDMKYKFRSKSAPGENISTGDMYQMAIYALKYGCKNVLLIYPQFPGYEDKIDEIIYSIPILGYTITVETRSVNLLALNDQSGLRLADLEVVLNEQQTGGI